MRIYVYRTIYPEPVYQLACKAAHRHNLTECFDVLPTIEVQEQQHEQSCSIYKNVGGCNCSKESE